ncbi:hypothetical protein ACQ4LE_007586 [Meloidogyne hapla]
MRSLRCLRPSFFYFSVKNFGSTLRGPVIGINFGFTNSSVAILEDRKAKVLKNDEGSILTPSVVAFTKDDEILVGAPAIRQSVLNSQNTIFGIKRLSGRKYDEKEVLDFIKDVPYKIIKSSNGDALIETQGNIYSPPQLASFILKKLKKTAENYLNKKVRNAIITVPSYFNDSQKQALRYACKLVGVKAVRVFKESTAAALSDLDLSEIKTIAVYNLGGGIFNFSILKLSDDEGREIIFRKVIFKLFSTHCDSSLGGIDFDYAIVNYIVEEFKKENGIDLTKDSTAMQRLREAAEKAKCKLSNSTQTEIILPNIILGTKHINIKLSRSKFEELTADLFQKTAELCKKSMKDENLEPADIDQVLLVGGMSKMPRLKQIFEEIFGEKSKIENKYEMIATGALYLGVLFGHVNYIDGRITNIKKESFQNFYNAERFFNLSNNDYFCKEELWKTASYIVKEFYKDINIKVLTDEAVKGLGKFAAITSSELRLMDIIWRSDTTYYDMYGPLYKRRVRFNSNISKRASIG